MRSRLLLAGICLSCAACAVVIGADFDRELAPAGPSPSAPAPSVEAGSDGAPQARADGGVEVFATDGWTDTVQSVFSDGSDVYWSSVDGSGGPATRVTLRARAVDGTNDRVIAAPSTSGMAAAYGNCFTVVGAGGDVWLANSADKGAGTISRMDTDGAGLVDRVIHEEAPCALAVLNGKPYWWPAGSAALRTSTESGGATTLIEAFRAQSVEADGTSLFVDTIATAAGFRRAVLRVDVAPDGGASLSTLHEDVTGEVGGLTLSSTHVFWADTASGSILSVPKAGGSAVIVVAGLGLPRFVAYRDAYLYFTSNPDGSSRNAGTVARVEVSGGDPVGAVGVLASARDVPRGLAVDATHVYWIETSNRIARARLDGE